jgi:hypothetical protein
MAFKDSGARTEFDSGARRDTQEGKGRMDLLPWRAIMELSRIYEDGCLKYGDRNWEKGIPLSRYADSGPRHFAKWMIGRTDEPHLDMAIWNFMSMLDTIMRIKDGTLPATLNDLPCNPSLSQGEGEVKESINLKQVTEFLDVFGVTLSKDQQHWLGIDKAENKKKSLAWLNELKAEAQADAEAEKERLDDEAWSKLSEMYLKDLENELDMQKFNDLVDGEWPEHKGTIWALSKAHELHQVLKANPRLTLAEGIENIRPKSLKEWDMYEETTGPTLVRDYSKGIPTMDCDLCEDEPKEKFPTYEESAKQLGEDFEKVLEESALEVLEESVPKVNEAIPIEELKKESKLLYDAIVEDTRDREDKALDDSYDADGFLIEGISLVDAEAYNKAVDGNWDSFPVFVIPEQTPEEVVVKESLNSIVSTMVKDAHAKAVTAQIWRDAFPATEAPAETADDLYMKPISEDEVDSTPWLEGDDNDSA